MTSRVVVYQCSEVLLRFKVYFLYVPSPPKPSEPSCWWRFFLSSSRPAIGLLSHLRSCLASPAGTYPTHRTSGGRARSSQQAKPVSKRLLPGASLRHLDASGPSTSKLPGVASGPPSAAHRGESKRRHSKNRASEVRGQNLGPKRNGEQLSSSIWVI